MLENKKGGARGESKRKEERVRCNNPRTRALQPNLSTLRPDKITMWQDLTEHDLSGPKCDSPQRGTRGYIAVKAKNVAASPKHVAARPKYVRVRCGNTQTKLRPDLNQCGRTSIQCGKTDINNVWPGISAAFLIHESDCIAPNKNKVQTQPSYPKQKKKRPNQYLVFHLEIKKTRNTSLSSLGARKMCCFVG